MKAMLTQTKANQTLTTDLAKLSTFQELSDSLAVMKPNNSETTQLITYALLATAVVGIFVYHYIKQQET